MDFGSLPKDQGIGLNSYLIDNNTNFDTLFYITGYTSSVINFCNVSALWRCAVFVQMLYVCENARPGRRGFGD